MITTLLLSNNKYGQLQITSKPTRRRWFLLFDVLDCLLISWFFFFLCFPFLINTPTTSTSQNNMMLPSSFTRFWRLLILDKILVHLLAAVVLWLRKPYLLSSDRARIVMHGDQRSTVTFRYTEICMERISSAVCLWSGMWSWPNKDQQLISIADIIQSKLLLTQR